MRTRNEIQAAARERQEARDKVPSQSILGKRRPDGIALLSLITGIAAGISLFVILPSLSSAHPSDPEAQNKLAGYTFYVWGESITGLIGAAGLWFLVEWARILMIARAVVAIIYQLLINASQNITGGVLFQILLMVAVLTYLLQPVTRKAFTF